MTYIFCLFAGFLQKQGSLYNIRNFKSHTDLQMDTNRYGSFRRVDENEVNNHHPRLFTMVPR